MQLPLQVIYLKLINLASCALFCYSRARKVTEAAHAESEISELDGVLANLQATKKSPQLPSTSVPSSSSNPSFSLFELSPGPPRRLGQAQQQSSNTKTRSRLNDIDSADSPAIAAGATFEKAQVGTGLSFTN
jgi:hypothetical protein